MWWKSIKAQIIHALGGVTADEQWSHFARPLKRQLADNLESMFKLGQQRVAPAPSERTQAETYIDNAAQRPYPQPEPPTSLEAWQASNDAFEHNKQVYAQHIRTQQAPAVQSWPTRMKHQPGRP